MNKLKYFVRTSVLGGVVVVLPVGILVLIVTWLFGLVTRMVRPVTLFLQTKFPDVDFFQLELLADAVVVVALLAVCFVVGISVRTRFGRFVHESLENWILRVAPGYGLIKETVLQFLGHGASPFSQVALVSVYANGARATAFITDEHDDGSYTVFIPTGPNPTSGGILHVAAEHVELLDITVDEALRSIIACGSGSKQILSQSIQKSRA